MMNTPNEIRPRTRYAYSEVEGKGNLVISFNRTVVFTVPQESRKSAFSFVKAHEHGILKRVSEQARVLGLIID